MTKVQVYFLAATIVATPHLSAGVALGLACVAGFLCWRALKHGDEK